MDKKSIIKSDVHGISFKNWNLKYKVIVLIMDFNKCSPIWTQRPKDHFPVFSARKIMLSQLMLVFLVFVGVDFYIDWRSKKKQGNFAKDNNLFIWRDTFYRCFGDHVVGLGFALVFSPYIFQIILSIFHMLMFVWLVVWQIKQKPSKDKLILYMRMVNIALFLCGMVGVGRCGQSEGGCDDFLYNR